MGVSLPEAPLPQAAEIAKAEDKNAVTLRNTPMHILKDQAAIWTSPVRIRPHDLEWLGVDDPVLLEELPVEVVEAAG